MDEQKQDEMPDESLREVPPAPVVYSGNGSAFWNILLFMGAGAVSYMVLGGSASRTSGATRSARLQWEERCAQIEEAAKEAETGEPPGLRSDG